MLKFDFDESVGCWVNMTAHEMRRALDNELARENITFRQWEVLAWITLEGEPSQVQLAEKIGIEAPHAGRNPFPHGTGRLARTVCLLRRPPQKKNPNNPQGGIGLE